MKPSERIEQILDGPQYRFWWPFHKVSTKARLLATIEYLDELIKELEK